MATQTKVEPSDGAAQASLSPSGASSRVISTEPQSSDAVSPASGTGSVAPVDSSLADDEDVSLDELMISDSNEGDEPAPEGMDAPVATFTSEAETFSAPNDGDPPSEADPFTSGLLDDEAAAIAAAAAAQEAAAQAAAIEADARMAAARRTADPAPASRPAPEPPRPRRPSSPPPMAEASSPVTAAERMTAPPGSPEAEQAVVLADPSSDLSPPSSEEEAPLSVEFEPPSVQFDEPPAAEPVDAPAEVSASSTASPSPAAGRGLDSPLPSFDIPEVDSARSSRRENRANPLPLATPLSHLSEAAEEDDDDAVTHIGLPVVPEAESYADPPGGFQVADTGVAAMRGFDPEMSLADARRAATRILPRIDPAQLEPRRPTSDTNSALTSGVRVEGRGAWFSGLFNRAKGATAPVDILEPPPRRKTGWLLDTVLPPLSLVLFGSGIGAGIMLLQPDRGAKAAQTQAIQALAPSTKRPTTLAERAEAGEGDALFKITNMPPDERSSALTLALERGYQTQKQNEFKEFAKLLEAPGGLQTPDLTTRFLNFATSPETMLSAFSHLLAWPGSTGPDVLYTVWEKAPGGNRAASLAQQLLHSADQRRKATPALITALDLRSATTCEDYLRVLPAVQRDGDQRCSATLRALKHTDGCGDDGKKDCFACLRDGTLLDDALKAIEGRSPPQL